MRGGMITVEFVSLALAVWTAVQAARAFLSGKHPMGIGLRRQYLGDLPDRLPG